MSFNQLKPEIWLCVIAFLAPPIPSPLSGCTKQEYGYLDLTVADQAEIYQRLPDAASPGAVTRKDIRPAELAKLLRVSIVFNQLASYYLYNTVITDDLFAFVEGLDEPSAHPQVGSKCDHLRHVRTLFLEYKAEFHEPQYQSIMKDGSSWVVVGQLDVMSRTLRRGFMEAEKSSLALSALQGDDANADNVVVYMPNLSRLAIGAIFGGHAHLWKAVASSKAVFSLNPTDPNSQTGTIDQIIDMCGWQTVQVFRRSPLLHYCQRSISAGPYAPPFAFDWADKTNPYPARTIPLFTMHLVPTDPPRADITGHRTRWLVEDSARSQFTSNELCRNFAIHLYQYHLDSAKHKSAPFLFDIEAYSSSNRYVSPDIPFQYPSDPATIQRSTIEDEAAIFEKILQAEYKSQRELGLKKKNMKGISSWRPSTESPPCQACGWHFSLEG